MYITLPVWLAFSAAVLPLVTAFSSITLPLRRVPTSLQSRQNAVNIIRSSDPKQANSVAIQHVDYSYMVAVKFGNSKKEYNLLLDSGSSNTWVMSQDCASEACKTHNTFGEPYSSSLKYTVMPWGLTYGVAGSTTSVAGFIIAYDKLHIGQLSADMFFGLVTWTSENFPSVPWDGILGMGRGVDGGPTPLIDVLSLNFPPVISSKLYGLHLSRGTDNVHDGELNIGAINKDRFSGDLNWNACIDSDVGVWQIPLDDAGVDGIYLGLSSPRTAIIDTGSAVIVMPKPDALKLHSLIPGSQHNGVTDGETVAEMFSVPCDTTAVIKFEFNKQTYNISTADWRGPRLDSGLCLSMIIGHLMYTDSEWIIGDVFLKNVYTVFDYEGKRVGFGTKSVTSAAMASNTSLASADSQPEDTSVAAASSQKAALVAGGASHEPTVQARGERGAAGRASFSSLILSGIIGVLGYLFM